MPQACLLAVIAGCADTVGYLRYDAFAGLMTGNTIPLGIEVATNNLGMAICHVSVAPGAHRDSCRRCHGLPQAGQCWGRYVWHTELVRIGTTSVTVHVEAWVIRRNQTTCFLVTEGNFTYVALGDDGNPRAVADARPMVR